MRFIASRCLAVASPLLFALSACTVSDNTRVSSPMEPEFGKPRKPSNASILPSMTISPTSMTISVGATTTVSVTYRDNKGNIVPDADMRLTYYGCIPVAPAGATCNDLVTITPVMPYLRQAEYKGVGRGEVRIYASDGLGTYVYADLTIE